MLLLLFSIMLVSSALATTRTLDYSEECSQFAVRLGDRDMSPRVYCKKFIEACNEMFENTDNLISAKMSCDPPTLAGSCVLTDQPGELKQEFARRTTVSETDLDLTQVAMKALGASKTCFSFANKCREVLEDLGGKLQMKENECRPGRRDIIVQGYCILTNVDVTDVAVKNVAE